MTTNLKTIMYDMKIPTLNFLHLIVNQILDWQVNKSGLSRPKT
jgi:hypothetical protein